MSTYLASTDNLPDVHVNIDNTNSANNAAGNPNPVNVNDGTSFYHRFLGNADFLGQCLNKKSYQPLKRRGDGDIGAGHVGRYISLANPDRMSALACHVPAFLVYSMIFMSFFTYWLNKDWFFLYFMSIGAYVFGWGTYMSICSWAAILKCRKTVSEDWNAKLMDFIKKNPGIDSGMLHFCVLPNYAEDEDMLSQTIQVVADNCLSKKYMVVVLAMEAREGEVGQRKAKNLIDRHKHLFRAMFATYHPANIPGEVKGKSSNTQWAFRDIQRWYGSYVSQNPDNDHDTSKVFVTIADADSIFNDQYFPNLTLDALQRTVEDRSWLIWQPPILNMRNIETVPGPIRTAGYGSFLFECSGLYSSSLFDHMCFSTYSISMGLLCHPIVDGWDTDIIAEDHHMYLKCLFASYWEELIYNNNGTDGDGSGCGSGSNGSSNNNNSSNRSVKNISKLKIQPIWCPVTSYMVEVDGDWWGSITARYQQARRHMQGVAELSYICLQHVTIVTTSREAMPWRAHLQLFHLVLKYSTIMVINNVYSLLLLVFVAYGIIYACKNLFFTTTNIANAVENFQDARETEPVFNALVLVVQWFMPIISTFALTTNWLMVKDTMEGKYCPIYLQNLDEDDQGIKYVEEKYCTLVRDVHGSVSEVKDSSSESLSAGVNVELAVIQGNSCKTSGTVTPNVNDETSTQNNKQILTSTLSTASTAASSTLSVSGLSNLNQTKAPKLGERVIKTRKMSNWGQFRLLIRLYTDLNVIAQTSLLLFGTLPVLIQSVCLSRYGHKFDYIVAGKPPSKNKNDSESNCSSSLSLSSSSCATMSTKVGSSSAASSESVSASDAEV